MLSGGYLHTFKRSTIKESGKEIQSVSGGELLGVKGNSWGLLSKGGETTGASLHEK